MSKTVHITSPQHFADLLASSRIVVVDFYADWCGPCKTVAPVYEQLSTQLSRDGKITFTKVNTDHQKDIARTYNVGSLPTFIIFKASRETQRITGADPRGLDSAVRKLAQEAGEADNDASGSGLSSAGGGETWLGATAPKGHSVVNDQVDIHGLDFLNLDSDVGGKRAIFSSQKPSTLGDSKGKSKATTEEKDWIASDTDEQLMLYIPFQSTLKLHSIHITSVQPSSAEGSEEIMRPKTINLYTNRSHVLGFDEADDTPVTQALEIKASDWDNETQTAKLELRFVKFQNISSVVIFVVDGQGEGEKTRIDRIRLFGESGEKRAMGKLEKMGDEQGE